MQISKQQHAGPSGFKPVNAALIAGALVLMGINWHVSVNESGQILSAERQGTTQSGQMNHHLGLEIRGITAAQLIRYFIVNFDVQTYFYDGVEAPVRLDGWAVNDGGTATDAGILSTLGQQAIKARDEALAEIATWSSNDRNDVTTVAAGYNRSTGQVAVGIKRTSVHGAAVCAEDLVVAQLGGMGQIDNIMMTPFIRPRTMQVIPVCRPRQKHESS